MKNIHVLPTDKPSRVRIGNNRNFVIGLSQNATVSKNDSYTNQNIYITSDEPAYPYALHLKNQEVLKINAVGENSGELYHDKGFSYPEDCKKIILTTDQDLIKDGVQAINNEFLEWFVKNPSCDEVEVVYKPKNFLDVIQGWEYTIISKIPKEEVEKETLQEVAQRIFSDFGDIIRPSEIKRALEFAKWQQERMYSEEEVIKILIEYDYSKINDDKLNSVGIVKKWFEQFKNK